MLGIWISLKHKTWGGHFCKTVESSTGSDFTNKTSDLFLISLVYNWRSNYTGSPYSFYSIPPQSHSLSSQRLGRGPRSWLRAVCLCAGSPAVTAVKNKWLYISVPTGNAIQAFGYGIDNVQNKSVSVPAASVTTKMGSDWSTATSEPPFVTIPKVIRLHWFGSYKREM